MPRRRPQSKELLRTTESLVRICCALAMVVVGVNCVFAAPGPPNAAPTLFQAPSPLPVQPPQPMQPAQPMPAQSLRPMPYQQQPYQQQPPVSQAAPAPAALPEPIYWKQH